MIFWFPLVAIRRSAEQGLYLLRYSQSIVAVSGVSGKPRIGQDTVISPVLAR